MFIKKEELEQIRRNIRNLDTDTDGLFTEVNKIDMLIEYLDLELVDEPAKKYFRKKTVQKKPKG